jgi:predicted AlkP superfamily pyrophosphatase or phosphodiesterase
LSQVQADGQRFHVLNRLINVFCPRVRLPTTPTLTHCRKIETGFAYPFTGHALPPTVTLPRIKALTTGSIPNFLDAILNIAESDTSSTLAYQDTWLSQANASGKRIVMYGDDTWIKLFPGMFGRSDGTSSFFVSVCPLSGQGC